MRREQYDEADGQPSDDSSARLDGGPGGDEGRPGAADAPATPADEWEGEPDQERLGRDLDAENR